EKRVFLVILFTSFSGSLVSRIPGAVHVIVVDAWNCKSGPSDPIFPFLLFSHHGPIRWPIPVS
ncbi:hypothetical protein, partial [Escherichia coli]|uniref:hypothetical protein n=1 Tax=Escherichia coli TaxID=562 RepID=UPI001CDA8018